MNWALAEITWRPAIGDATLLAWCITAGYFLVSFVCVLVARRLIGSGSWFQPGPSRLWLVLATTMFFLGWNKQLDLQILLTQVGREFAKSGGWYGRRRPIQAAFAISCSLIGMICVLAGLRAIRGQRFPAYVAYTGVVLLLTFIAIRAASFHHIDALLYAHPMFGNWLNISLESGGILLVTLGGMLAFRSASTSK